MAFHRHVIQLSTSDRIGALCARQLQPGTPSPPPLATFWRKNHSEAERARRPAAVEPEDAKSPGEVDSPGQ